MAKYDDTKSLGKSQIVPFKRDESWHQRHARRMYTNLDHAGELKNWCDANDWKFEVKNNGHHWIFKKGSTVIEWWPSSAKLVKNKQWNRGVHCHDYEKVREFLSKEKKMKKHKCPKCGSERVDTVRSKVGPMWCMDCKFRVEHKEQKPNPFEQEDKPRTILVITRD